MTMPDERVRSLRWGHEWLVDVAASTADPEIASKAADLLRLYPKTHPIDMDEISEEERQAVMQLRTFLMECRTSKSLDPELKRQIVYVLRHFPSPHFW